ncbi:hypothetical protein GGR51DRAFT_558265 [Nemania sp. FL0031]|nr:hypothetical protein GGR51DRAFT_558265 [Nemania sp. FL0031]
MMGTSLVLARLQRVERQDCPKNTHFFTCGNMKGCCPVDPCKLQYMYTVDPCSAALQDKNGGDEETTSTTTATSTSTPIFFSITDGSTSTSATDEFITSTSETEQTSSASSSTTPSVTSSVETSTTAALPSGLSTSVSTSSATGALPAPTSAQGGSSENASLSRTAIAGVSIAGAVGGIALILLAFWLVRRRRLAKRMSSIRGGSPNPPTTPDEKAQRLSLMNTAPYPQNQDPFAEFGGAVNTPDRKYNNSKLARPDEGWPLCVRPMSEETSAGEPLPAQLDSRPACVELDAAEGEHLNPSPGPSPGPSPRSCSYPSPSVGSSMPNSPSTVSSRSRRLFPLDAQILHPPQLTPGFPGTQMAIQNRSQNDSVGQIQDNVVEDAPRDAPRATLNATNDERVNNLYANSWATGP